MGTRNVTAVIKDGEFKVIKYCQWDGYPSGRGVDLLNILRDFDYNLFTENLKKIKYIDNDIYKMLMEKIGIDPEQQYITMEESDRLKSSYPSIHRDYGPEILNMISNSKDENIYVDPLGYGNIMLGSWCEWFYVIDLDEMKLYIHDHPMFLNKQNNEFRLNDDDWDSFNQDDYFYNKKGALTFYDLNELPTDDIFVQELEYQNDY